MDTVLLASSPEQEITQKLKRPRLWPAILALYVLAAIIPECVATFNTAPRTFLVNPPSFFFLTAFYGSANVLMRELVRRQPRRLLSLLLLGIAFGFVNEGVIAGTWYTVKPDGYLFIGGIDWGWAVALTMFHTLYSVIIPIFLVEAIFPSRARINWLRRRGTIGFGILLAFTISFIFFLPTYRLERVLVLLIAIVLVIIAARLPLSVFARPQGPRAAPGLGKLRVAGFTGTMLFFGAILLVPGIFVHTIFLANPALAQILTILITLAVGVFLLITVQRWSKRHNWGNRQVLALITGALLPTILLSLILPPMWRAGQPVATLSCLALLLGTAYYQRKRARSENPQR